MRRVLLLLAIFSLGIIPSSADMTVEDSTDAEKLINAGYSQTFAEDVFISKNRALGKPIEPLYEKSQNRFVKLCRKFYAYLDPAQDEYDRIHHDIHYSPSMSDL